ncbi:MAG: hypothetical protein DME79_07970 [Verrucomicrobia bacterium]|nr:MAG: hypothetical protein DME79_07970 [Verrucomicrobiota bacterium]
MKRKSSNRGRRVTSPPRAGVAKPFFAAREHFWLFAIALAIAPILVYLPVWKAGFIWDDDAHLTRNPCVIGPLGLSDVWSTAQAFYYPLVLTTFWVLHKLVGLNPWPYHIFNVLLHAGSAVLLWRILQELEIPGAWLGAALWALHPVMVQSVAWVTELKNTQSCLFYLLSILCFLKWEGSRSKAGPISKLPRQRSSERRSLELFALSLVFFVLATLSKPSVVMLPAVLALCIWWRNPRVKWRDMVSLAPFVGISAIASVWTIWEQRFHSGAVGLDWAQTWPERFIIAGRAPWFYLSKLLWPHPLIFMYPRWAIHSSQLIAWLPLLATLVGLTALWFVHAKWGRAVFFAAAYFVVSLFPVLGFFSVYFFRYSFVSDHFQYLASMGPIALVSAGLLKLSDSLELGEWTLGILICAVLGTLTWRQSGSYSDIKTLWRTTIQRNPSCWMAENNLASELLETGDVDGAIAHFNRSLELKSDYPQTHYNLAYALLRKGGAEPAIGEARVGLTLDPNDPEAHVVLGMVLMTKGQLDEAVAEFSKALEIRPNHSKAHYNLAIALLDKHQTGEAIAQYEKAIEAKPDYVEALTNLAWILATSSDAATRGGPRAVELAQRAAHLTRGVNPFVLRTLAAAYANVKSFDKALETSQRALELAQEEQNAEIAEGIQREMSFYRNGQPYRAD